MKKLFLLSLFATSLPSFAQQFNETKQVAVTAEIVETIGETYKVRSREINIDEDKKVISYTGDVVFITDMITLEADKVVYDHITKQVVATGNFRAKGVSMDFKSGSKPKTLKYTIGDTIAYLE
jgi:lipopolysaccharide assembly outer membrane protein LptD (OstA)